MCMPYRNTSYILLVAMIQTKLTANTMEIGRIVLARFKMTTNPLHVNVDVNCRHLYSDRKRRKEREKEEL